MGRALLQARIVGFEYRALIASVLSPTLNSPFQCNSRSAMSREPSVWRPLQHIRPISIGLLRHNDEILVMRVGDSQGRTKGWRPLGGTIEFGESASEALKREFVEELGQEVHCLRLLCVLENLYNHEGADGHEIVFVFETAFANPAAYEARQYEFVDGGARNEVGWVRVDEFLHGRAQLFPESLVEHLG